MQRGAVMAELAAVQILHRRALQQLDVVAVFLRAAGAEGFQQVFFGFGAGEQVRAVALELQPGHLRPVPPDLAAFPRQVEHRPRWLAGDQSLAEVAHRGAQRRGAALEDLDLEAAFGGCVGVGQAEDAGADDQQVAVVCH